MLSKLSIPLLRKLLPTTLANKIVDVQPMPPGTSKVFGVKYGKVSFENYVMVNNQNECVLYDSTGHIYYAVDIRPTVEEWLLTQPIHMWKHAEETDDCHVAYSRYIVCEELLTWMTLRWG
jgi:hypothetical protein